MVRQHYGSQPRGAWDPLCNMPSVEAYLSHLHELQAADSEILKGRENEAFGTSDPALPYVAFIVRLWRGCRVTKGKLLC